MSRFNNDPLKGRFIQKANNFKKGYVSSFVSGNVIKSCGFAFPSVAGTDGDSLTLLDTTAGTTEWAAASGGGGGVFDISGSGANPYSVDIADSGKTGFLTGTADGSQEIILPDISTHPASDGLTFTFKVAADYSGSERLIFAYPGSSAPTSGLLIGSVKWNSPVFSSDADGYVVDGAGTTSDATGTYAGNAIGICSGDAAVSADEYVAIAPAVNISDGDNLSLSSFSGKWYISGGSWLSHSIELRPNICATYSKTQEFESISTIGTIAADFFGYRVAISGNVCVIGAIGQDSVASAAGCIYIFEQKAGTWTELAKCDASDGAASDNLGSSVAIHGDWAVGGAYHEDSGGSNSGAVYLYQKNSAGVWPATETQKIVASDASASDYFGSSVAISGDYIAVGAPNRDIPSSNCGAIYVFLNTAGTWAQTQILTASDAGSGDIFGDARGVSMSGEWLIGGAKYENGSKGAAYLFERTAGTYSETQKIVASLAVSWDLFGWSVSISGDWAVIGAPNDGVKAAGAGAAYVFKNTAGTWAEATILYASNAAAADEFGVSVSIDGDQIVVGAPYADTPHANAGSAYIFSKDCGGSENWGEVNILNGLVAQDQFGTQVANSWASVLSGSPYHDLPSGANCGQMYAYTRN